MAAEQRSVFEIYKKGQGVAARWMTAAVLGALSAFGSYELREFLSGKLVDKTTAREYLLLNAVPWSLPIAALVFLAAMIGVALAVNSKKFVDYLIASETELRKVAWPKRDELKRQTVVVIVTMLLFAVLLFVADVIFAAGSAKLFLGRFSF